MTPRSVALLAAVGVIAVAGGWYFGTATMPVEQTSMAGGKLMFPDLAPHLREAARIEITHQGKPTVIEKRPDGGWGIASMRDYPVREVKLRGMLTALTELRLAEPRTTDPAEFSRLGVDDPNNAASTADLLRVVNAAGAPIVALIVGHHRVRSQADTPEEVYVRRPGENQSWLAEGSLQVDADTAQWLDRNMMNIGHDRLASVVVGDNALVFGRPDGKFTLTQPADHPKLEDYKVADVARALELLTFQTVKADAAVTATDAGHATFTTSDGLAVAVTVLHADKDVWSRFKVSAASDKARAEADRLNARLAGWTYEIGSWKEKSLVPTMADLKAPEPPKTEPATSEPAKTAPPKPELAKPELAKPELAPGAPARPAPDANQK